MKKTKKSTIFDFDTIPVIMGVGIEVIQRELNILAKLSEERGLTDAESKLLISYIATLREVKKDYIAEVELVKKELKAMSTQELEAMLGNDNKKVA